MESTLQRKQSNGGQGGQPVFAPRVDVFENEEEYLIQADLPGVTPDSLDLTFADGELSIEAGGGEGSVRRYRRAFTVPDGIDASAIEAQVKDGVLTLHLPKAPEVRPRRIEVQAS